MNNEHHVEEDLAELQKRIESLQGRTREDPGAEDTLHRDQLFPDAEDIVIDDADWNDITVTPDAEEGRSVSPDAEERRVEVGV